MCRARRGGPRTPSKIADTYLDCAFVENALFLHGSLILKSQQNRIELVTRPALNQALHHNSLLLGPQGSLRMREFPQGAALATDVPREKVRRSLIKQNPRRSRLTLVWTLWRKIPARLLLLLLPKRRPAKVVERRSISTNKSFTDPSTFSPTDPSKKQKQFPPLPQLPRHQQQLQTMQNLMAAKRLP